jgi:hypothetical protein
MAIYGKGNIAGFYNQMAGEQRAVPISSYTPYKPLAFSIKVDRLNRCTVIRREGP